MVPTAKIYTVALRPRMSSICLSKRKSHKRVPRPFLPDISITINETIARRCIILRKTDACADPGNENPRLPIVSVERVENHSQNVVIAKMSRAREASYNCGFTM